MLESYMEEQTKTCFSERIELIEEKGLSYRQHGKTFGGSKHFDFSVLINALDHYVKNYAQWFENDNWHEIEVAWIAVGKAQREAPAHVAHEYCRPDRSFDPLPSFNEETLPRALAIDNYVTQVKSWFPVASSSSGLGFDFAVIRRGGQRSWVPWAVPPAGGACGGFVCGLAVGFDLAAILRLNEVRTTDLAQSRENLNLEARSQGLSM
jgi:hypothetical protein